MNLQKGFNINTKSIALDDITAEFLCNMRHLRETQGFTQKFIADYANTTRTCVTYYEQGKSIPSLRTLIKLAEVLKYDISQSVNYKFFHRKINPDKIMKSIRVHGFSFVEISSIIGYSPEIVICTMTALILLVTGTLTDTPELTGAQLALRAFEFALGPIGKYIFPLAFCCLLLRQLWGGIGTRRRQ